MTAPADDPKAAAAAFARWLAAELAARDWSQNELARRIGSYQSVVNKWGRGQNRPRPAQCRAVADALGVPLDVVLDAAGHRPLAAAPTEAPR